MFSFLSCPLACIAHALLAHVWLVHALPRPVVIWHGMGDFYSSEGIARHTKIIQDIFPGIFVHSIYINEDESNDQRSSIFGNINDQIEIVNRQLLNIPELKNGFDAIGFSQGGLFLRAYIERFNSPSIKNLITFGSPHNGISDLPGCAPNDWLCKKRNAILKNQVWSNYAQNHVLSAQYFRDPEDYDSYLEYSTFLVHINNEKSESYNETYKQNLSSIEKLILIMFLNDETVIPKQSSFFEEYNKTTGITIPLNKTNIYINDLIGLKSLYDNNKIINLITNGEHMEISDDFFIKVVNEYLGTELELESSSLLIDQYNL